MQHTRHCLTAGRHVLLHYHRFNFLSIPDPATFYLEILKRLRDRFQQQLVLTMLPFTHCIILIPLKS